MNEYKITISQSFKVTAENAVQAKNHAQMMKVIGGPGYCARFIKKNKMPTRTLCNPDGDKHITIKRVWGNEIKV